MGIVFELLRNVVLGFEIVLLLIVSYLLFLTLGALIARRRTPFQKTNPTHRFAILIPAHNEERLLPMLLANLHQMDYPKSLYTIYVVADNCTDQTAQLGRANGAVVYERHNQIQIGKGYALDWLLQQIWERNEEYDAALVLDADSIVSSNFLQVMDARLDRGERVIQAYYAVRDPDIAWSTSLRSVALIVLHYLRPLGRMAFGFSSGLKGNGMVFTADITKRYRWSGSLTEDLEYHMSLVLNDERAMFAPDAIVWAEMPNTLAASQSQNARWEQGRLEVVKRFVPQLLRAAMRKRSLLLFDAAVEQLIPPFSVVVALSGLCLLSAIALQSLPAILLAIGIIVGQMMYVLTGLLLARAPLKTYQSLLYAPVLVLWKIMLYVRVLAGLNPKGWVRTARNDA